MESLSQIFPFASDSSMDQHTMGHYLQQACYAVYYWFVHPDSVSTLLQTVLYLRKLIKSLLLSAFWLGSVNGKLSRLSEDRRMLNLDYYFLLHFVQNSGNCYALLPEATAPLQHSLLQLLLITFAPWAQEWWWLSAVARRFPHLSLVPIALPTPL